MQYGCLIYVYNHTWDTLTDSPLLSVAVGDFQVTVDTLT